MKQYRLRNVTEAVRLMNNDDSIIECLNFVGITKNHALWVPIVKRDGFLEFDAHYEEDNKAKFGDWIIPRGETDIKGNPLFIVIQNKDFEKIYVEL